MRIGKRKHEEATVEIVESQAIPEEMRANVREVLRLYVPSHHRKKGLGRALLKQVCEEADKDGTVLMLWPRQYGDGEMETAQLISWYKRFGFIETQSAPVLMMRQPRLGAVAHMPDIAANQRRNLARAINRALH